MIGIELVLHAHNIYAPCSALQAERAGKGMFASILNAEGQKNEVEDQCCLGDIRRGGGQMHFIGRLGDEVVDLVSYLDEV
jgi:hypothetical protein